MDFTKLLDEVDDSLLLKPKASTIDQTPARMLTPDELDDLEFASFQDSQEDVVSSIKVVSEYEEIKISKKQQQTFGQDQAVESQLKINNIHKISRIEDIKQ